MPPDDVDALYALPLEDFVPARDALAKGLRKEKRRDEAAEVAALAKPTRPAWMVNQLARNEGALTAKLLESAEALAEAQEAALSGEGAADLRAASRSERRAVDQLVAAARKLRPEGRPPSEAMLERVRVALQAAAADEALREAIRTGRLTEEPAAGGAWPFGGPEAWAPAAGGKTEARRGKQDAGGDGTATARAGRRGREAASEEERSTRRRARRKGDGRERAPEGGASEEQAAGGRIADGRAAAERAGGERAAEGGAARRRAAEDERAAEQRAAEERATRRKELQAALSAARKDARTADRDRERARKDADRAAERLRRLSAEVVAAEEAAEGAAERRRQADEAAAAAEAEVARLEAELRER